MERRQLVAHVSAVRMPRREVVEVGAMGHVACAREKRRAVPHVPADVVDVKVCEDHEIDVLRLNRRCTEELGESAGSLLEKRIARACRPDARVDEHDRAARSHEKRSEGEPPRTVVVDAEGLTKRRERSLGVGKGNDFSHRAGAHRRPAKPSSTVCQ